MSDARRVAPWLATAALAFLAWRALSLGLADQFADDAPARALRARGDHPEALLRSARLDLVRNPAAAAAQARATLHGDPLDGRAYRVLAEAAPDPDQAHALLTIAVARAPRDIAGHARLADHAFGRGEFADALAHIDQMLRVEPPLIVGLYPVLEAMATTPAARTPLLERLAAGPAWREHLLALLSRKAPDAAAIAPLFEGLAGRAPGLREVELAGWIDRLVRDHQWGPAYLTWVQALPPPRRRAIGNVYDGGFEAEPSGVGFDWRIAPVPGALVQRLATDGAGGQVALRVRFDHRRVPFRHVRQLLALPPGAYRLDGRTRLEALQSERGLVWTIACAETGAPLADTAPFSGTHGWAPFGVDFTVPASGCGGQWLTLRIPARIAAEQRIGGSAWFDDLSVRRAALR